MDVNVGLITALFFLLLLGFLALGVPMAFALGGLAVVFMWVLVGPDYLAIVASRAFGGMTDFILLTVPLFIFMGMMLENSGIAENLYRMMYQWSGPLKGGLAAGTVGVCMIFAAMSGVSATATITMGVVALPQMLKRGYKKSIALGCISAGGALGVLIPPSLSMVMYSLVTQASVGKLFAAGIFPGLLLGFMFIAYILVRCALQPAQGPALPKEDRANWPQKFVSLKAVIYPIILIVLVLGSILAGVATPTEGAGLGAFGALLCAAINRKLSWTTMKKACAATISTTAMALWILIGSAAFAALYNMLQGPAFIQNIISGIPGGVWVVIIVMQIMWFIMGCFLDPIGIIVMTMPIFGPIITGAGLDLIWFGAVAIVNMEMAYLTPPFGYNLFYLKGVAPPEVKMTDIYGSVWPFVILQATALAIVLAFPAIVLWLPGVLMS